MAMTEDQICTALTRLLDSPEHEGLLYGAADSAPRNARGDRLFDALKALVERDLEAAASEGGSGHGAAR